MYLEKQAQLPWSASHSSDLSGFANSSALSLKKKQKNPFVSFWAFHKWTEVYWKGVMKHSCEFVFSLLSVMQTLHSRGLKSHGGHRSPHLVMGDLSSLTLRFGWRLWFFRQCFCRIWSSWRVPGCGSHCLCCRRCRRRRHHLLDGDCGGADWRGVLRLAWGRRVEAVAGAAEAAHALSRRFGAVHCNNMDRVMGQWPDWGMIQLIGWRIQGIMVWLLHQTLAFCLHFSQWVFKNLQSWDGRLSSE